MFLRRNRPAGAPSDSTADDEMPIDAAGSQNPDDTVPRADAEHWHPDVAVPGRAGPLEPSDMPSSSQFVQAFLADLTPTPPPVDPVMKSTTPKALGVPPTLPAPAATPVYGDTSSASDLPSVLSRGVVFEGHIRTTGPLHLEGRVEGTLEAPMLTLGETGTIQGEINCRQATINGTVDGNFLCGSLEVGSTARLSGTVRCSSLSLGMGAVINASVEIGRT